LNYVAQIIAFLAISDYKSDVLKRPSHTSESATVLCLIDCSTQFCYYFDYFFFVVLNDSVGLLIFSSSVLTVLVSSRNPEVVSDFCYLR